LRADCCADVIALEKLDFACRGRYLLEEEFQDPCSEEASRASELYKVSDHALDITKTRFLDILDAIES
jgi:hypothetical protein